MFTSLDRRRFLRCTGAASLFALGGVARAQDKPETTKGLVTGQPEGAAAGMEVLSAGGNAVDAAVTAALVAGVVALPSCGIGGYGGHLVVGTPEGKVSAIDFNTTAPAAAREDMYPLEKDGTVKGRVNQHGWLAAGVPGTLAGLQLALDKHGTQPLSRLLKPAIRHARDGFKVSRNLARSLQQATTRLKADPGSAGLLLKNGDPLAEGATFRNPELADMLEKLAEANSVKPFYQGEVARRIAAAFKKHGGLVTADDHGAYEAREVAPVSLDWCGYTIWTAPLTAGGLTVLQALATLKALRWEKEDPKENKTIHARLEALRIAWHDRLALLGDPKKFEIPIERLLSHKYADASAGRVREAVAAKKPAAATGDGRPTGGTVHLSAVDAKGMMVALTLTHGEALGASVTVEGMGLILGHGMLRFDPRPKHPNSPGPGKRPLHNMCPTVIVRDGRPVVALGAHGGRRIPNTLFDVLVNLVGQGRSLVESVKAPRMHTQGSLELNLTAGWPASVNEYLTRTGYVVKEGPGATLYAIARNPKTGALSAASP